MESGNDGRNGGLMIDCCDREGNVPRGESKSRNENNNCEDYFRFEAPWWHFSRSDDGPEDHSEGALLLDEIEKAFPDINREQKKILVDILTSQKRVLRQICGSDVRQNDDGGTMLDLNEELFLSYEDWLDGFEYYEMAFMIDLVGCLRRHMHETTPLSVRISDIYLENDLDDFPHLLELLIAGISSLPNVQGLYLSNDEGYSVDFKKIRPILKKSAHRLKELRLNALDIFSKDELIDFASCFARAPTTGTMTNETSSEHERWGYLKTLAIENTYIGNFSSDPIFSAIAENFEEAPGQKICHFRNLENFRLIQRYSPFPLSSDETFVRFLKNRSTIKRLTLIGIIKPRHVRLMEIHLSTQPNIETVELDVEYFFRGRFVPGCGGGSKRVPLPEEEPAIRDAMQSLVRLAIANPNIRTISVGGPFESPLDDLLQSSLREIFSRTRLNRNGLKNLRGRTVGELPPSPSTRREHVEFLVSLQNPDANELGGWPATYGDDLESLVAFDALYLSLRMRPDVCLTCWADSGVLIERDLAQASDGMNSLSL